MNFEIIEDCGNFYQNRISSYWSSSQDNHLSDHAVLIMGRGLQVTFFYEVEDSLQVTNHSRLGKVAVSRISYL